VERVGWGMQRDEYSDSITVVGWEKGRPIGNYVNASVSKPSKGMDLWGLAETSNGSFYDNKPLVKTSM